VNLADKPLERAPQEPTVAGVRELGDSPALPRVEPRLREAFARLHDRRAPALSVPLGGERLVLEWVYDDGPTPPCDVYRFRLGPNPGRLGLDVPALAALLAEPRPERIPKALRCVLLADALQEAADALAAATRLHFEWTPGDEPAAAGAFDARQAACFRVAAKGWRGFLQFDDPGVLAALLPPLVPRAARPSAALERLRFPLRFEIGSTRLRLHEVRGIQRGDIVAIESWRAAGAAVIATAEVGGPGGIALTGRAEGSRITLLTRDDSMNRTQDAASAATEPQESTELMLDRLDALEVSLRFEVGELEIALGELRNLRPGHVFELGAPLNRSAVRILAHGNLLGKGTLVAVGDRLGVRVSEFAPGEL
jgi:type III secretion protein Q